MATFDKPDLARIQAGLEVLQGRGAAKGGRANGELAGQFAAMLGQFASMLQSLNGAHAAGGSVRLDGLADTVPGASDPEAIRCAWPGLATLLAQNAPEMKTPANTEMPPPPDVDSLVAGAGPATDFRWIAHLVGRSDTS